MWKLVTFYSKKSQKKINFKFNSDQLIDSSKFSLHEAYCYRNCIKCPKCNESIDKKELIMHDEEYHKMVIKFLIK